MSVQNELLAAEQLTAELVEPYRVRLRWARPVTGPRNATAYSFRVLMRRAGTEDSWTRFPGDKDLLEYTAGPLAPFTQFEFTVLAYGIRGDGPTCPPVSCTTGVAREREIEKTKWKKREKKKKKEKRKKGTNKD
jgi:hypothetical protein